MRTLEPTLSSLVARSACAAFAALAAAAPAWADVGVDKVTSNVTPTAGGSEFAYTITLTNNDAVNPAVDVVMTDPLPPSVLFESVTVDGTNKGSWSCTGPAVGTNGLVECTAASFPASGSATVTIVAKIAANVTSGVRTNTARVVAGGAEDSASVQQNIQVDAPLSVAKSGPAAAVAGDYLIYLLTLTNVGSSSALNVTLTDSLPAGTRFVSAMGTGGLLGTCRFDPVSSTLTCFAKEVATGAHHVTLLVQASAALAAGTLTNTATIASAGTGTIALSPASVGTQITVNEPPVAADDDLVTGRDVLLVVAALGPKANDSDDEDGQSVLDAALVGGPANGTLTVPLAADGSFTYSPNPGWTGVDTFTYTVTDSRGATSNVATVTIGVQELQVPLGPWTAGALVMLLAALGAWVLRGR